MDGSMNLQNLLLASAFAISALGAHAEISPSMNDRPFLDLIGNIEAPGGYDTVIIGAAKPEKPLTQMTINEVLSFQKASIEAGNGSAAGRYQFIRKTLRNLVEANDIPKNAKFDEDMQDYLARLMMEDCGFYKKHKSAENLGKCLAKTWAALPDPETGASAYGGENKALTDVTTLISALQIRTSTAHLENIRFTSSENTDGQNLVVFVPKKITIEAAFDHSIDRNADPIPLSP